MYKKWNLFILLLLFSHSAFSFEKIISFFLDVNTGITSGSLGEYLYTSSNDRIISYLEYEEKPLIKVNPEAGIEIGHFGLQFSADYFLPLQCGHLYDSDWKEENIKTNYGIFENYGKSNYRLSFSLMYNFSLTDKMQISPVLSAEYRYNSFSAKNGYGWYGDSENSKTGKNTEWNDEAAVYKNLSGIEYFRSSIFILTGLVQTFSFNKLDFSLSFLISPYSYFYSQDTHRDDFAENDFDSQEYSVIYLQNGIFSSFNFDLKCIYKITQNLSLSASVNAFFTPIILGRTFTNYYSGEAFGAFSDREEWIELKQKSGIDFKEISFDFGIIIKK